MKAAWRYIGFDRRILRKIFEVVEGNALVYEFVLSGF